MDLVEYREQARSLRLSALLWLTLGLPLASLGGASFVLGALIGVFPKAIPDDEVFIGVAALVAIGIALLVVGGIPCLLGLRSLARLRRLRQETAWERMAADISSPGS